MSNLVSKDDNIVREWIVRRKMEFTFIDIIASKGSVVTDFRKASMLKAVERLISDGFQITELSSNRNSERNDMLVTLQHMPGTVTKGMTSSHAYKEVYSFSHGRPVGESRQRKRHRGDDAVATGYDDCRQQEGIQSTDESEDKQEKTSKFDKLSLSDNEDFLTNLAPEPEEQVDTTKILSKIKISNRVKKMRRRRAFRQKLQQEQQAKECEEVTQMVKQLKLLENTSGGRLENSPTNSDAPEEAASSSPQNPDSKANTGSSYRDNNGSSSAADSTTWDDLKANLPYTSEDDVDFGKSLENWEDHKLVSEKLAGLGFTAPVDIPIHDQPNNHQDQSEAGINQNPNDAVTEASLDNLTSGMSDLDLEEQVRSWYDITPGEEARLLGSSPDDMPELSVEELTKALEDMIEDMDKRLTRSLDDDL